MVAQKELSVPGIERGGEKKTGHASVSHFLKAAIRRIHATADNSKSASRHLLAQVIVLSEMDPHVESAQLFKASPFEQHEHASAEGTMHSGELLK